MLIVITIMVILMGIAAAKIVPATQSRRSREAARALNVYLSSARNRALETGRPCGVILHRASSTLACAMSIDQCEVPPCYCGETETSYATVTVTGSGTATATLSETPLLVSVGDGIQFNYQGRYFTITAISGATLTLTYDTTQGQQVPAWNSQRFPYRIFRFPVKAAASPLQLPASAVVDLAASGIGSSTSYFGAVDVTILFSPNGSMQTIYLGTTSQTVVDPVYLLVGKRERVGNAFQSSPTTANRSQWPNYQDLDNIWIVISPLTGLITSEQVASSAGQTTETAAITAARSLAADAQGMGGK